MELVRCRMCGADRKVTKHGSGLGIGLLNETPTYVCECKGCGIKTNWYHTDNEALEAWNKLMGVTLDEVSEVCIQQDCECPIYIEELSENCQEYCLIYEFLRYQDKIEQTVRAWRGVKNETKNT